MKLYNIIAIIISSIIILLISFSPLAKDGAINGIRLCEETIIPALLPILILTNIIINSKCTIFFEKTFGWIVEKLFKLPKCAASAILFGLIAGYPAGAILTNKLVEQGLINIETAKRIMRMNFSGGLAFIITAVGSIKLDNSRLGLMLFISCIIPSIIIGIINGFVSKSAPNVSKAFFNPMSINDAMVNGVETATKSVLIMSGYIILFSSICAVLPIPSFISPILEITNGIFNSNKAPIEFISFFLSFGGICVHLQIISFLPSYFDFLVFRLINASASYLIMRILIIFYPVEEAVFSNQASITPQLTQANAGFGIIMIIGCAVIVFDIENRRLKLR